MEKLTWEIRKVKLSDLKPLEKNPFGKVTEEKKKRLRESLHRLGNFQIATVDTDMVLLTANKRFFALQELGETETEVKYPSRPLTEAERKEIIVSSNLHEGEWIAEILAQDYQDIDLEEIGLDVEEILGKSFVNPIPAVDEDTVPDSDKIETDIVLGDLIEIGPHRLLCGDSTNADHVEKVLNGEKPFLMITDIPYGVNYDPEWRNEAASKGLIGQKKSTKAIKKVENDFTCSWSAVYALSPSKVAYVYHASRFCSLVYSELEQNDFEIRNQIIWAKNNFAISRGHYHWKHEPLFYAVKKDSKANWIGDRSQTTVWNIDKPLKSETGHSTQKPVECMAKPMANHEGDVYEPFAGSGTTMVAAHKLGRKSFCIEILPEYCQIIINRMLLIYPGIEVKINGKPFNPK